MNAFAVVAPVSGLLAAAVLLFKFQGLWVIDKYSHWLKYKGVKNKGTTKRPINSKIMVLIYEATVGQGEAHIEGLVVCCWSSLFVLQRLKFYILFGFV